MLAFASAVAVPSSRRAVCSPKSVRAFSAKATADYIILGAGSAGCVLTNRLSEDPKTKVLLLEYGSSDRGSWDSWKIQMPAALTYNLKDNKYNWDYWTEPQTHLNNRRLHQPRGKVLGGSSSLNAMAYIRGHALDYDRWEHEQNVEGWGYRHCLPYFIKAQNHLGGKTAYRGIDGPLQVSRGWYSNPLNDAFVESGIQAGYPRTDDLNGFQQEGFGPMHMTVGANGERCSTANAYLRPAMKRNNVEVKTNALITRILFEGTTTPKAVGVEYVDGSGNKQQVFTSREVLVCLGAFGSPQVAMLSGIGDQKTLHEHSIHTVCHSPQVGQNLQDHIDTYVQYLSTKPVSLYPYATFKYPWFPISAGAQWFLNGKGICSSNHFEVGGFIRSRAGIKHPDIQYHFIPACVVGQLEVLQKHGFQAHCSTMRPLSTGFVTLRSNSPLDPLIIDPKYMHHPQDMEDLRNGLRLTFEILSQPAMSEFRGERLSPEPALDIEDDKQLDEWIRNMSHSAYHPSCTMAMGSVTDHNAKVIGVENLRIIDASIMPSVVSGNLNAPTIMLAEKLADAVKGVESLPPNDAPFYVAPNWETSQR